VFDNLSEKLGGILDRLTRRGALTEADVDAAMREVRRALLEADVSLDVVRSFTEKSASRRSAPPWSSRSPPARWW
jgi:signal recognition particle subunit SRP54